MLEKSQNLVTNILLKSLETFKEIQRSFNFDNMPERQWTFTETQIFLRLSAKYDIEDRGIKGTHNYEYNLKKVQSEMSISGYNRDFEQLLTKWRTLRHQYRRYLKQTDNQGNKKSCMFKHADAMKDIFKERPYSEYALDEELFGNKSKVRLPPKKTKVQIKNRTVLRPIKPKIASEESSQNNANQNITIKSESNSNVGNATLLQLLQEQNELLTREVEKSDKRYAESLKREKEMMDLEVQDRNLLRQVLSAFHRPPKTNGDATTNVDADFELVDRIMSESALPSLYPVSQFKTTPLPPPPPPAIMVVSQQPLQASQITPKVVAPLNKTVLQTPSPHKKLRLILSKDIEITKKINVSTLKKNK